MDYPENGSNILLENGTPIQICRVLHPRRIRPSKYFSIRRVTINLMLICTMELFFPIKSSL